MANILLGVTGSVAAVKTPLLFETLKRPGHAVRVVATRASLYFFDATEIGRDALVLDEDEWPGRDNGRRWQRDDEVLHIQLRRWADVLVIAPLDANTLAKLANGLADNCLTCVWRAWEPARRVVLAPAMNTLMWQHPATARHLRQVAADMGLSPPDFLARDELVEWINAHGSRLRVAAPESRLLACGDVGIGAMAAVDTILEMVQTGLLAS
ncbi:MAG TPA: flavoprotein [Gemmataceae bacterium]|jgi:phosphopantothenoylcysteine decarboxylase